MALDDLSWARIAFTSAIAALVYGVMRLIQVRHSYKDLPKPPHSFLFGHLKLFGEMFGMLPNDTHYQVVVTTIAKKYNMPGIFYLDLWPVSWSHLVVIDPDVAMEFTVTRSHPKHEAVRRTTDPLIGKGNIASAEGPHWKHLHKMMSPAFSITNITEMRPIVATEVMKYRSILQEKAKSGKVFRLEDLAHHLTFDIISRAATGRSFDTQTKGSLALQHFEAMVRASMKSRESFNYIGNFFANRVRDRERRKLDALVAELIKERFDFVKNSDLDLSQKRGLCIMDLMLRDYFQSTGENKRTELDSEFLTNAITQVKTLLIAGSGTTSDTVCFGHMLLSVHPEVVQKMREEHDHVFAPGIDATYDLLKANPYKMNDLVYTIAVIKEILRFYPIGNTAREGMDTLTYQGQQWPSKGKMVCPVQLAMHMDPKHFEDPLKFDPERFIRQDYTRIAWRPFERGPRACIGKTLAMDELTLVFLLTARDFDFACADLKPNKTPRTEWNSLDLTFGDRAYQEFVFEASPRDGMPMIVKNSDWPS